MKDFIQKIVISILGVLFLAGFNKLFPQPSIWHYASLLSFIILFYYLLYPFFRKIWFQIVKRYRIYFPKIGILNGNIYSPVREHKCQKGGTNVTPSMWFQALKRKTSRRTEYITTSQINNSYSIILNPFGDIFPEQDIKLHTTFYSIADYIKRGGIFVVTGGAFFSHQNTVHSSQHQWVITKTSDGLQSITDSLLFMEFGLQTTGDQFDADGKSVVQEPLEVEIYQIAEDKNYTFELDLPAKIKRFRAVMPSSSDYIPFVREKEDKTFPIVAVRYGSGYLIQAGLHLESEASPEFSLLVTILDNIIKNRFKPLY